METKNYKLRDKGTTFYDSEQQKGIVAHRVTSLELTPAVHEAVRAGRIIEVEDDEAQESFDLQAKEQAQISKNLGVVDNAKSKAKDKPKEQSDAIKTAQLQIAANTNKLKAEYKAITGKDAVDGTTDEDLQKGIDEAKAKTKAPDTGADTGATGGAAGADGKGKADLSALDNV